MTGSGLNQTLRSISPPYTIPQLSRISSRSAVPYGRHVTAATLTAESPSSVKASNFAAN